MTPDQVRSLTEWLTRQAGARSVVVGNVRRLSGGAISVNLAIDLMIEGGDVAGPCAAVLRSGSPSGVSASLDKVREAAVLKAAFDAGVMAPEPLFVEATGNVLGAPFYLMRRATGLAAGHRLVKAPTVPALAYELGRQLGRLHAIRPGAPGLDFLPMPTNSIVDECLNAYRDWLGDVAGKDPVLAYALRWLDRRRPAMGDLVLSHRDYRTGNYMVDDGRLTAIIDWEFAGWSDAMEDIGWFCAACWRFGQRAREAGGIGNRADFYAGYEQASGRSIDHTAVGWWEVMAHLRWAAIAVQQAMRHVSGAEPSLELALTGRMVTEISYDMLQQIDRMEGGA
ncbi:aminoglycoside phosphotransferase [Niveispirillum lacus]|uniref:Aminoglycoside phosphotransferase n=1 Tax=Niveispirillum lacus TaxID=1981099 RepID=A0A255Z044_9PROT|nr:aminoglycoside phosphotransferase [Niveispirillum lacus]